MQAGATGRHRPFPEKRASIARLQVQAGYQARTAWREIRHAPVRLRQPAARKAEAAPHVRRARAPVPPLLRRSRAPQGLDRHEPAAAPRVAPRQRRLPHGLRLARAPKRGSSSRHGSIMVNGKVAERAVGDASSAGDVVSVTEKAKGQLRIQDALQLAEKVGFPSWVEVDAEEDDRHVQGRARTARNSARTSTKAWWSSCIRSNWSGRRVGRAADAILSGSRLTHKGSACRAMFC